MSQETPETIMHTWMRRVWNELDDAAIDELMAPDARVHGLTAEPIRGTAGWRVFYEAYKAAFDEIHITIDDQIVDGEKVAILFSVAMVHRASGTPVEAQAMAIVYVRDGKVVEGWNLVDFLPMLVELDFVPADALDRALAPAF